MCTPLDIRYTFTRTKQNAFHILLFLFIMNPNIIVYPIPYNPSSLPALRSNDDIQYHHHCCYSVPLLKVYVPVHSIQQHYFENYRSQMQYTSRLHQYRYYGHDERGPILKGCTIPYKIRKSTYTNI